MRLVRSSCVSIANSAFADNCTCNRRLALVEADFSESVAGGNHAAVMRKDYTRDLCSVQTHVIAALYSALLDPLSARKAFVPAICLDLLKSLTIRSLSIRNYYVICQSLVHSPFTSRGCR